MAADVVGSVRAEGLEPGAIVIKILDRWSEGTLATEQLGEAAQFLASGESVAHLLGEPEINAVHPFREGNGRAERAFLRQLALDAGHTLTWEHLDSQVLVHASQHSLRGDNLPMRDLVEKVLDLPGR